ncbi:MAG: histidine phosphatase family protein [Acidimicrobiales bacterium]|jgi:broad specificity phosphatase PhoE
MAWHSFEGKEPESGERTVLVARHGRTVANEEGIHQNWGPYELSPSGLAELGVAKRWWSRWDVAHHISSPVPRAVETAKHLWSRIDELDVAWGERAVPAVEGLTLEEAHRLHPNLLEPDGWVRPGAPTNPFVESSAALNYRVQSALLRAAGTVLEGHVVAVMTHGALLAAILTLSEEGDLRGAPERSVRCGNLAVLEISADPAEGWNVRREHSPLTLG